MLRAAGSALQTDLDNDYPSGVSYGEVAVAAGHGLPCKQVYVGALAPWGSKKPDAEQVNKTMRKMNLQIYRFTVFSNCDFQFLYGLLY